LTGNIKTVDPRDDDDGITLKPRMRVPKPAETIEAKLWLFKESVFFPYVQDDDATLARAFAADYAHTSIRKNMSKQPQQEEAVKAALGAHYKLIKACFKHCCALSSSKDVYNVGWNSFTEFTNAASIPDQNKCNRSVLDMIFIGCNLIGWSHYTLHSYTRHDLHRLQSHRYY
jgi:hypothetical protein